MDVVPVVCSGGFQLPHDLCSLGIARTRAMIRGEVMLLKGDAIFLQTARKEAHVREVSSHLEVLWTSVIEDSDACDVLQKGNLFEQERDLDGRQ